MKKLNTSFRLDFDEEDVKFMSDYKEEYGTSFQFFVGKAVKNMITEIKLKMDLGMNHEDELTKKL